ncbi:MAG: nicotinate-nucleotide adenylyltransferase [Synergistaceae bacterium]|jgi:nicotinate-nucleotide adenylyltransferase|nr:nicotinate-nucleotide adenylyltransferase [Synergistaceae bacterium]
MDPVEGGQGLLAEKIGIMGGTFDPVHYGHLLAAEECRRELALDRIVFVPTGTPPHKRSRPITPSEDRYAMTLLATAGVREFFVSRTEIDRDRSSHALASHTVDTLKEFLERSIQPLELFFITGLDALLSIDTWKDYMRLPSLCTLVTATRPGYSVAGVGALPDVIRRGLKVVEIPQFAISSTEIRSRVREGRSIRFLVPHLVENYIESCGLYKGSEVPRV